MADTNAAETSFKQLIQNLTAGSIALYQGTVISASPLKIQIANDEKLVITESNTYLPRHLTDYTTTVDLSGGTWSGETSASGEHNHSLSITIGEDTHSHAYSAADIEIPSSFSVGEDGETITVEETETVSVSGETESYTHNHTVQGEIATASAHTHTVKSASTIGATMTVYNALKVGETVHVLSFSNGKQFYVLDRVA